MGDPRRLNRQYDVPRMKWNSSRIYSDKKLIEEFGLKTKKEIWKAETEVRKLRKRARLLLAGNIDNYEARKGELLNKLIRLDIFNKDHKVEDVLKLNAKDILERRLQTLVFRKGLATTPNQARQLIVHGHIAVNGRKRTVPSSLVIVDDSISYTDTNIKNQIEKSLENKGKTKEDQKIDNSKDQESKKGENKE